MKKHTTNVHHQHRNLMLVDFHCLANVGGLPLIAGARNVSNLERR